MDRNLISSGLLAFAIAIIATPIVVNYSKRKGYLASINHRSSHDESVPNTGGIILYFSVLIPLLLFSDYHSQADFTLMISAFSVLVITGIIDDFNPIPVIFKFLGQFIPAIVIVTSINAQELALPFLHDHLHLPGIFNYIAWIVFIVMTINAFNLIDGVDGLAASQGLIISLFFAVWFYMQGDQTLMLLSAILAGSLLGFLFFNFSPAKIFMGDSGSMTIGVILSLLAIWLINSNNSEMPFPFDQVRTPLAAMALLAYPLTDTLRIFTIRAVQGKSPFAADKNHIHHKMLLNGFSHAQIVFSVLIYSILLVLTLILTSGLEPNISLVILLLTDFLLIFLLMKIKKKHA